MEGNKIPEMPKTWLTQAILVTIFCCVPFGIVGIVYAARIEQLYNQGKYDESLQASLSARKWTKLGFIIGLVAFAVMLIFNILILAVCGPSVYY